MTLIITVNGHTITSYEAPNEWSWGGGGAVFSHSKRLHGRYQLRCNKCSTMYLVCDELICPLCLSFVAKHCAAPLQEVLEALAENLL